MPLDEKEKEELKKRYKEHRQAIWSGKHSRKLKRKDAKRDVDNFVARKEKQKASISPEQQTNLVETENAASVGESKRRTSPKLSDSEEQNQMVILRRPKERKSVSEASTKIMSSVSERTTLYEPEPTRKTEVKSSSLTSKTKPDDKTTMFASLTDAEGLRFTSFTDGFALRLEQNEPQSKSSSSSNVAELSTKLAVTEAPLSSQENMLKEKIKSQRQEIWAGVSSQKKRRQKPQKQNTKKAEQNLGIISAQNPKETKKGLTLGVVFIGIAAVVAAVVLGVLLGYLLA